MISYTNFHLESFVSTVGQIALPNGEEDLIEATRIFFHHLPNYICNPK